MKTSTNILLLLFLLSNCCSCHSQIKRTDIIEFGLKGKLKSSICKTYSITDSTDIFLESKNRQLELVYTNYYNAGGNLDSTTIYLPTQSAFTSTVYVYSGNVKSGWKKYDQNRQLLSFGTIDWPSDKQYIVKEYDTSNRLTSEIIYALDESFRHKTTSYKGFDSTGKLIRDNVQTFEINEKGEILGYKMEKLLEKSNVHTEYKYSNNKDIKGNPLKVLMHKDKTTNNDFGTINEFEYTYY